MRRAAATLALASALALAPAQHGAAQAPAEPAWRTFEGSWSMTGQRQELPTEGPRPAAILAVSGAVVITRGDGLARGFRGEALAFDDGSHLAVGRCVFTDERGDRIFATLAGEEPGTGRRVAGTITGGTGRYAGITGTFTFDWQMLLRLDDGAIEARTTSLAGRYRPGPEAR